MISLDKVDLSRIAIIGCPGSGKSILASRLSRSTNTPMYHLDKLFFRANWVRLPLDEQLTIQQQLISGDKWIIEGNWWKSWSDRLDRATVIIHLNYSRATCMTGIVARRIKYANRQRDSIAEGCRDRLSRSFVSYVYRFRSQTLPQWDSVLSKHACKTITLTSRRHADKLLEQLNI